MKKLYHLPAYQQWIIAILSIIIGFSLMIPLLGKSYGLLIIPLIAPLLNLSSVHFLKLVGYYKYLNPYVISTIQTNQKYDLHNVFTYDYLINFKWKDKGSHAHKVLLGNYLLALITIIERIENGQLSPEVKIIGNSYFFNERTAKKLGFSMTGASIFWKINSCLQFIELTYLYSFSQGKLAIPKFWKVKKVETTGIELLMKKEIIMKLSEKILPSK